MFHVGGHNSFHLFKKVYGFFLLFIAEGEWVLGY